MELSFDKSTPGITHIKVTGKITQAKVTSFAEPIAAQIGAQCYAGRATLDLSGAEYVDSSGVSWLLVCHKRFREAGGRVVLHSLSPMVLPVIKLLRMDQVFEIAADRASAEKLAMGGTA